MAFFNKMGNILRQTAVSKHVNHEMVAANPSIFQMIRCISSTKLFVGGLAPSTDWERLRETFSAYGDVRDAKVKMNKVTGRSRGFGFITFVDSEAASAAIQALDQSELDGRRIKVTYADVKPQGDGGCRGGDFGGGGDGGNLS